MATSKVVPDTSELIKKAVLDRVRAGKGSAKTDDFEFTVRVGAATIPATEEMQDIKEVVKAVLKEGEVWLSQLLNLNEAQKKQMAVDLPVRVFKDEEWPEEVRSFIPSVEEFETYVPRLTMVYDILAGFSLGDNVWLTGLPGTGKSSLVKYVCALTRRPFIRVNGRGDLESGAIFGQYVVQDGQTIWKDGICTLAVKVGACFLQDEPTVIPAEISMGYQWLLEHNGKLVLTDKAGTLAEKIVTPHPNFRFVCADNTRGLGDDRGNYSGTGVWNTATLDRFGTTIDVPYMSKVDELAMIKKVHKDLDEILVGRMIDLAQQVRNGFGKGDLSLTMSPRSLLSWAAKIEVYGDMDRAFRVAFFEKFGSSAERKAISALYKTVFSREL